MLISWISLALAISVCAEDRFPVSDQPLLIQERTFDRSKDTSVNESRDFRIRESATLDSTVEDAKPFLPRDISLLGRESKETEASRVREVTVFATTTQIVVATTVDPPSTSFVLVTVTDIQTFSDLAQGRTTQTVTVTSAIPQKRAAQQIDARATTPSRPQPSTEPLSVAADEGIWPPDMEGRAESSTDKSAEKTKEKATEKTTAKTTAKTTQQNAGATTERREQTTTERRAETTPERKAETSTVTSTISVISRSVITQTPITLVTSTVHVVNSITVTAPVSTTVMQTVIVTTVLQPTTAQVLQPTIVPVLQPTTTPILQPTTAPVLQPPTAAEAQPTISTEAQSTVGTGDQPSIVSPTLTAMAATEPTDSAPAPTITAVPLPTGLAAGIAVGMFSGALVVFVIVLLCVRRSRRKKKSRGGDRPLIVSRPLEDGAASSRFSIISSRGPASRFTSVIFRSPRPSPSPPANPKFAERGVNVAQPADMSAVTNNPNFYYGARRAGTDMQQTSRASGESVRIGFKPSPPTTPERSFQPQPPQPPRPSPPYQPPPPSQARLPPPWPPRMMTDRPPPPRQPINFQGAVEMSAEAPQVTSRDELVPEPQPPRRGKLIRHPSALPSPLALGRSAAPLPRSRLNQQQTVENGDSFYGVSYPEGGFLDGGERQQLAARPGNLGMPAGPVQGRNGPMMWTGNREGVREEMPGFL